MYYDYKKILSYNALLNILIGERGVGKTYGASKMVINNFIKKSHQFAYIRRYKPEIKKAVPQFFEALKNNNEFKDHLLTTKGNNFYCDGEICGYAMTLSTAQDLKSSNFSKVTTIIFDEFIIEEGQKKYYLQNEVQIFLNLLETIGRMRNIRVFMLANPANIYSNPYFLYFDLSLPYNNDIKTFKNNLILVQYMKNEEYRQAKKQTRFGQLISGTTFEDYAVNNKCLLDNKNFIDKKQGTSKFSFAFIYNGQTFGVWFDYKIGKIFVSNDYDKNTINIFACTSNDHTPNTMLINSAKKFRCWKLFIENYNLGNVYFENMKIKIIVQDVIKMFIN